MSLAEIYKYLNSLNLLDYVKNSRSINHSISSQEIFINRASNAATCGLKHFKYLGSKLWITIEREISSQKSVMNFNNKVRTWIYGVFPCVTARAYIHDLG